MITDADNEYGRWNKLFRQIRGRNASRDEFRNAAVGRNWLTAMEILSDSAESDQATADGDLGAIARRDNWEGQIVAGNQSKADMQKTIDQLNDTVTKLQADDNADKAKIDATLKQIADLTAQLEAANKSSQSLPAGKPTAKQVSLLTKLLAKWLGRKKK